ncbi:HEPN domain-containing protein [bacterium]|nr:HEPN domain-containing protein [bacterium]
MKIPPERLSLTIISSYSFYKSGLIIRNDQQLSENLVDHFMFQSIPSSVNSCLSIELSLKELLSQNSIDFEKTHNIKTLYDSLPEEIKLFLETALSKILEIDKDNISKKIDAISNTFVEWRYYGIDEWTNKQLEFDFCETFAGVLIRFILKLNPNTARLIGDFEGE